MSLPAAMNKVEVEPQAPEKKRRRKQTAKNSSPTPSFSLLPDDITENYLARISRSYYPTLSLVSKTFRSILSSTDLNAARSRLGRTEQCLYICLNDWHSNQWITFCPNRTMTKKSKKMFGQLSALIPCFNFATNSDPTVVGSEIYMFGGYGERSCTVRVFDCLSHSWRDAPSMNVPRQDPASCAYDGKIYVLGSIGGSSKKSWGEVFDIKTQTWEYLPEAHFTNRRSDDLTEFEGRIYCGDGHTLNKCYDPKRRKWEAKSPTTSASLKCVMDNVSYSFQKHGRQYNFWWRNLNGGGANEAKEVKGLESFGNRYKRNGGSYATTTKTFTSGGKLYVLWEGYTNIIPREMVKIWCAVISVEKRDGDEIWGNVESFDVVHTGLAPCGLSHCLAVSV